MIVMVTSAVPEVKPGLGIFTAHEAQGNPPVAVTIGDPGETFTEGALESSTIAAVAGP